MTDSIDQGTPPAARCGDAAYVSRASADKTAPDAAFQSPVTDAARGHVWSRDTIPRITHLSRFTLPLCVWSGSVPGFSSPVF